MELLVGFSLLILTGGMIFGFYLFGVQAFGSGSAQVDLQQNVRIAADVIQRELRFATRVEVQQHGRAVDYTLPRNDNRYSIRKKGEEIVLLTNHVENKIAYGIEELRFQLCSEGQLLDYRIEGTDGEQSYGLVSAVRLRNLPPAPGEEVVY